MSEKLISEAQDQINLKSDLNEVHPSLVEWAEEQLDAGYSAEELRDRLRAAVRLVNRD